LSVTGEPAGARSSYSMWIAAVPPGLGRYPAFPGAEAPGYYRDAPPGLFHHYF